MMLRPATARLRLLTRHPTFGAGRLADARPPGPNGQGAAEHTPAYPFRNGNRAVAGMTSPSGTGQCGVSPGMTDRATSRYTTGGLIARAAPTPWSARRGQLDALQAGRMVAALMVTLYHANNFTLPLRLYDGQIVWAGFGMGYAGVEFFFVLSGFIMAHVHGRDMNRPETLRSYARKRFIRIYPVYWIVLGGVILMAQLVDGLPPELLRDPRVVLTSILLIPDHARTILPVAWTLKHEVVFYLVFAIFLVHARLAVALFALWVLGCLVGLAAPPLRFPADFLLSPYNLLFVAGMGVARHFRDLPVRAVGPLLLVGIGGFLAVGLSEQYGVPWTLSVRTICFGVAASALVAALARTTAAIPGWAIFLGNASYALYLVHLPVMNAVAIVLARLGAQHWLAPEIALCLLAGCAVAGAAVFHVAVERPLLAMLSTRLHAPRALQPTGGRGRNGAL